jgi:anti-sigma factor RsiW
MNCERAENLFVEYLYGELGQKQLESVQAHLDECPQCSVAFSELTRIRELAGSLPDLEPTQIAVNRVIAQAREEVDKSPPVWRFSWLKALAPLCLVAIVTGVVAYQYKSGMLSKHPMYAPERQQDQEVFSARTPSSEQQDRIGAPTGPKSEKDSTVATGRGASADQAPLQEKRTTEVAPALPAGTREPSIEEKSYRVSTRVPFERGTPHTSKESKNSTEPKLPLQPRRQPEPPLPAKKLAVSGPAPSKEPASELDITLKESEVSMENVKQGIAGTNEQAQPAVRGIDVAQQGDKTMVKARASRGDEKPGLAISAMLDGAEKAFEAKNYQKAAELFSAVIQRLRPGHVDRPRSLLGLARAQEAQGNLVEARRAYHDLAKESPFHRELAERKLEELAVGEETTRP